MKFNNGMYAKIIHMNLIYSLSSDYKPYLT
jgi:hypothetical protein